MPAPTSTSIPAPPPDFGLRPLDIAERQLAGWHRISRFASGEPFFGRSGTGRFDDSQRPARFGTCYLAASLAAAFGETLLRDALQAGGHYPMAWASIESRWHYAVQGTGTPQAGLRLADFRGAALRGLGLDIGFIFTTDYRHTQPWAVAVHAHPACVDGLLYLSRQVPGDEVVVLFDRARDRLRLDGPTPLIDAPSLARVLRTLRVRPEHLPEITDLGAEPAGPPGQAR